MEEVSSGAGLGALGFWIFIGMVVVGTFWEDARKREAQHLTLRKIIDSGQDLDPETIDKLIALGEGGTKSAEDMASGFDTAAYIMFALGPGLVLLGIFVGAFMPMMGVAALLLCLGGGFRYAAKKILEDAASRS